MIFTKKELIKKLNLLPRDLNEAQGKIAADRLLLAYIDHNEISEAYKFATDSKNYNIPTRVTKINKKTLSTFINKRIFIEYNERARHLNYCGYLIEVNNSDIVCQIYRGSDLLYYIQIDCIVSIREFGF